MNEEDYMTPDEFDFLYDQYKDDLAEKEYEELERLKSLNHEDLVNELGEEVEKLNKELDQCLKQLVQ